jgi:heat-inducible transcriptional repressor
MSESPLSERAQQLLKILIQRYIRDGEPVGSKTLASEIQLGLSPASIRNIMAELEERGFLSSPHTSAGRIPTSQGYRLFVDSLLTIKPLTKIDLSPYTQQLETDTDTRNLVSSVSNLLSGITHLAGIVTMPKHEKNILRHVEFVSLSANRVLVILVMNDKEVQNRIIQTNNAYATHELQEVANYINAHCADVDFSKLRSTLLAALRSDQDNMQKLLQVVIDVAEKTIQQQEEDFVLAGQDNLFSVATEGNMLQLRSLHKAFDACSLVTAPYSVEGEIAGVLGVIGPTRMSYDRIIPIVDITAKLLSQALKKTE